MRGGSPASVLLLCSQGWWFVWVFVWAWVWGRGGADGNPGYGLAEHLEFLGGVVWWVCVVGIAAQTCPHAANQFG